MKLFFVFFYVIFYCECNEDNRAPKFFFREKPHTVVSYRKIPQFVTEFVPSSCIVMEPTLPPCRHVRNLEIYPSVPTRIPRTQTPQLSQPPKIQDSDIWNSDPPPQPSEPVRQSPTPPLNLKPQLQIKTHSPYWNWNIFNPFRGQNVTYTSTKTVFVTTIIQDPHTVVSFYVRGCRPSRLPFNLPECDRAPEVVPLEAEVHPVVDENQQQEEKKNIVVMAPLKFVPGIGAEIVPSKSEILGAEIVPSKNERVREKETQEKGNEEEKNEKKEEIIQEKA